jgi:hypothetical protein
MAFRVGSTKLVSRKRVTKNPITVKAGSYTPVGTIVLPKGEFLLTHQIRLPGGAWAKVRFTRIGWPVKGKNDVTGLHPYRPTPDGLEFSDSFTHPLDGGGPVRCDVKVLGVPNGKAVTLETSIFKAKRIR